MQSRYKLAITEYYLPERHGLLDDDEEYVAGHIMLMDTIDDIEHTKLGIYLNGWKDALYHWIDRDDTFSDHPVIRNMPGLLNNDRYIEINIVDSYELSTGHSVCVLKTFWLRCFQRFWRRQVELLKKRRRFNYLKNREIM